MAAEAEFWSFPTNPDEFDQDERISYSKLDNKYIAVQGDGTEYEFDDGLRRWIPMLDEALIEEQQRGYMFRDANADADAEIGRQGRKRKMDHSNDREVSCARMHICSVGRPALPPCPPPPTTAQCMRESREETRTVPKRPRARDSGRD